MLLVYEYPYRSVRNGPHEILDVVQTKKKYEKGGKLDQETGAGSRLNLRRET